MLTIKNTYYMSLYIQFALLLFMLYHQGLVVSPELEILKKAYNLEFFVSIVEFVVYVFIIHVYCFANFGKFTYKLSSFNV